MRLVAYNQAITAEHRATAWWRCLELLTELRQQALEASEVTCGAVAASGLRGWQEAMRLVRSGNLQLNSYIYGLSAALKLSTVEANKTEAVNR